jgi:hypothetical protein
MPNSMLEKLAWHWVFVLTYPPHTSYIFQVLDVLLFSLVKRSKKSQIRDHALPIHVDHILSLFRAYEAAMASATIWAAWKYTGFQYENMNMITYFSINEGQVREPRDFREIWMFDYHESQLSARRQKQKWGWINKHKFRKKE